MDHYRQTFDNFNRVASIYEDKFMGLDIYNPSYDAFLDLISKADARILEIGCGPGNITKYLLSKLPQLRIEGIDMAPNMIELARKNNPAAKFSMMDARHIDNIGTKFEAVMCGFCFPYLSKEDCAKLIKDASALLHPGGVLYFSFIEDSYSRSGYETNSLGEKYHIFYHEENYLLEVLEKNNLISSSIHRIPYPNANGGDSHLVMIARKK
jgi:ubiquinone/menaquinone biosynthesis C-methylase UbiE